MELKLNECEIRIALAEVLAKKIGYSIPDIDPEECWFEAEAEIVDCDIDDIHNVKFCYKVET